MGLSGITEIKRRVGPDKVTIDSEIVIKSYTKNMGGVDCIDQQNTAAGGFASEYLGKKWFIKVFLSILDTMVNNGQVAWNMSAEDKPRLQRETAPTYLFQVVLAEKMINFGKEENIILSNHRTLSTQMHMPKILDANSPKQPYCDICKLEIPFRDACGVKDQRGKSARCKNMLVKCDTCGIIAHGVVSDLDRKILSFPEFRGKSCFEIAHMKDCAGLFHTLQANNTTTHKQQISQLSSHPILHRLWDEYNKENDDSPMSINI